MKKVNYLLTLLLLIGTYSLSMISCGSDEDSDNQPKSDNTTESFQYIEPCFMWGANLEQVKDYMSKNTWKLIYDQYLLLYTNTNETNCITYMFRGEKPGLYFSMVQYIGYSESKLNALIAETEKRYKVTLEKQQEQVEGATYTQFAGYTTINAKNVGIIITPSYSANSEDGSEIKIIFAIPD